VKCLTLTQPWATLVAIGAKSVETRSWNCHHIMKPLAIHAAKGFPGWAKQLCFTEPFVSALRDVPGWERYGGEEIIKSLPLGVVLCVCRVFGTRTTDVVKSALAAGNSEWYRSVFTRRELAFGDYSPGRWAWMLDHIEPLPVPIAAKGALGFTPSEPHEQA
jgi:activating signal cointegrator 1